MHKRTMAVFAVACNESLRNKCVQANQKPSAKKRQHVNKNATQANGGDGHGAIGEPPDHHGVDDGHAHPAKFGEHERNGELQGRAEFGAKCLKSKHVRRVRAKSVSGTQQRSNDARIKREGETLISKARESLTSYAATWRACFPF